MSFNIENFTPIGGQARRGRSPGQWAYKSLIDDLATVLAPGYFDEVGTRILRGDFIIADLIDGKSILTVLSNTLKPPGVVIDPTVIIPSLGNEVTTLDTLSSTQLLLGAGGKTVSTEPDLIYMDPFFGIGASPPMRCFHVDADIPDSTPLLRFNTTGSNGAMFEAFFGTRDPEGLITANPGDNYNRLSGIDSGLFIFEGAAPGNTGWREVATLTLAGGLSLAAQSNLDFGGTIILDDDVGGLSLNNIDALDSTTKTTIENAILTLTNLTMIGFSSGSVLGPSGAWDDGGFDLGPDDSYEINGTALLSDSSGTITLSNINALDATTEATILAISGIGNVTTSDTLTANQLLLGNGTSDIVTEPDLVWDGAMFGIAIADPISLLHIYENTANVLANAGLTIEQDGTGDAIVQFLFTGVQRWVMGVDNSDADKFKINNSIGLDTSAPFTITMDELFGFNVTNPETTVDINGQTSDALRLRSGNASGFTLNQIKMSLDGGVLFTHAIKTRHDEFNQFSNAIDFFLWDADEDATTDVGTLPVFTLKGDGKAGFGRTSPSAVVDILSLFGDTTPVIAMESTSNAGNVDFRVGNRNPNGMVTGAGPDVYYSDMGALSGTYENRAATTDQVWLKRSVLPANIIELHNSTELDDLASGGIITISEDTTWHVRGALTTANRIVINTGIIFHISGEFNAAATLTYTGTGTFFSGAPRFLQIWAQMQIISSSTGTLFDLDGGGGGHNLRESSFIGWDSLGTIANAVLFARDTSFQNIDSGITLINVFNLDLKTIAIFSSGSFSGPMFTINTNNPQTTQTFSGVSLRLFSAGGSLFDLNTRINNNASINIDGCSVPGGGDLFKQSVLTDATINSVADGSIATGTITAMADNGSGGTTISSTTTYFEDEEVTITGTTSYNGTFQIFNVVAGVSFDTITVFVADDATGSVDSVRLTLSLAVGHGISTGDSIKVNDTNFYNGFATTLNVVSDDITINGVFISTNTGSIERELSVDQTDRRVKGFSNVNIADSHSIACAHVNDNSTANGAIVNNTFTDQVFGTVGDALIASSTMELWRLVDEINGIFEYFGSEEFDGYITFDFTVVSAGGTVDFRFKWLMDSGSGFADLSDNVESLVAVGADAQSVTKTFPLRSQFGDQIKPQITRNSGTSAITTSYATVYVTQ